MPASNPFSNKLIGLLHCLRYNFVNYHRGVGQRKQQDEQVNLYFLNIPYQYH